MVTLWMMQPIHIDELLGGTWHWDRDDDDPAAADDLEATLEELMSALVEA